MSVVTCEIPFQPEIEACDFTRHGSVRVWFYMVSKDTDIDIMKSVPFHRAPFRGASHVTGLEIGVDVLAYPNLVPG